MPKRRAGSNPVPGTTVITPLVITPFHKASCTADRARGWSLRGRLFALFFGQKGQSRDRTGSGHFAWVSGHALSPSRPGEFRPEPLTEPDVNLSIHPARATPERLPPFGKQMSSCGEPSSQYH